MTLLSSLRRLLPTHVDLQMPFGVTLWAERRPADWARCWSMAASLGGRSVELWAGRIYILIDHGEPHQVGAEQLAAAAMQS